MGTKAEPFEFHASLTELDEALQTLHHSVQLLRDAAGRDESDRELMRFEIALGEIGANVLTHGRPGRGDQPIDYVLRFADGEVCASFSDHGPAVHDKLAQEMPDPLSESGRGLPMARTLLDELGYEREGGRNVWRLVKRL